MTDKLAALGVCDHCGEPFPEGVSPYTTKGTPRLCCSRTCRNALNSRRGAEKRSRQAKARVQRGAWENPSPLLQDDLTEEERDAYLQAVSEGVSAARKAEVEVGTWRNPALSAEAREKLSQPRVHGDNPALHRAIEKLGHGASVADLSPEEQNAHRKWRRDLYAARREEIQAWRREWRRKRKATEAGRRQLQRAQERQRARQAAREPNKALREARERAGLSQVALAEVVGLSQTAVAHWELYGYTPRDAEVRQAVEALLGYRFEGE